MGQNTAALLPPEVVSKAKVVAKAIRAGEVAPLVGAGLSMDSGIVDWGNTVRRMVLAWKEWDTSTASKDLDEKHYFDLIHATMGSDLAVISHLRKCIGTFKGKPKPSLGMLLYLALYLDQDFNWLSPSPRQTHRHLISLFHHHPRRAWTTNYDDLLEQAALEAGITARSLHPVNRREGREFTVAHLHGYLPPERDAQTYAQYNLDTAPIVLAEDDYHAISSDVAGWTNREFYRLFDSHRALILGMSLTDPNIRRVLQATATQETTSPRRHRSHSRHFAVVKALTAADCLPSAPAVPPPGFCDQDIADACAWRSAYWRSHGVELIELPGYDSLLPFLVRLRYESSGGQPGALWRDAAAYCQRISPWTDVLQTYTRTRLDSSVRNLQADFALDNGEIVEIGILLLTSGGKELELVFRGGGSRQAVQGQRLFSAMPDCPTGVPGCVFVTGDMVRIPRTHQLYDFGMHGDGDSSTSEFEGIIAAPIVDWRRDGLPLGVIYVTTTTTNGVLFELPETVAPGGDGKSLNDLYVWLQALGMQLVNSMMRP